MENSRPSLYSRDVTIPVPNLSNQNNVLSYILGSWSHFCQSLKSDSSFKDLLFRYVVLISFMKRIFQSTAKTVYMIIVLIMSAYKGVIYNS